MDKRTILSVKVTDVEKRRVPSKHYVYVIRVTWSDCTAHTVFRRYSRFFDFQNELLEKFPVEGGEKDPAARVIPFLPGKKFLGRSHVREVALKRLKPIDEYCQTLIKLPAKVAQCEEVLEFFETESEDLDPIKERHVSKKPKGDKISRPKLLEQYVAIADYDPREKGEIQLRRGMNIEVAEKTETGWWFVTAEDEQGWVPSTYLERQDGGEEYSVERPEPGQEEEYVCTQPFVGEGEDEVTLQRGAIVLVLEKNLQGWWRIRYNGQDGYVPAAYLSRTNPSRPQSSTHTANDQLQQGPVQVISSLSEISDFFKPKSDDPSPASKKMSVKSPPPRSNSLPKGSVPLPSGGPKRVKDYVTIESFSDSVGDGISFSAGQTVKVLEKSPNGWWYVEIGEQEGWAPAAYIQQLPETPLTDDDFREEEFEEEQTYEEIGPDSDVVQRQSFASDDISHASDVSNIAEALKAKFESKRKPSESGVTAQSRPAQGPPPPPTKPSTAPARPQVPPTKPSKPQVPSKGPSANGSSSNQPHSSLNSRASLNKPLVSPSELKVRGSGSVRPAFPPKTPAFKPPVYQDEETDSSESVSSRPVSSGDPMVNDITSALKARFENPSNGTAKAVAVQVSKPATPPKAVKPKVLLKPKEPRYRATAAFIAENSGEVSFKEGQELEVTQIDDSGWWLVKVGNQEGWAPAAYIEEEEVPDNTADVEISRRSMAQPNLEHDESRSSQGGNIFGARLKPVQKRTEDHSPTGQKGGNVPGRALLPPGQKPGAAKPLPSVKPKPGASKGALPPPPPKPR